MHICIIEKKWTTISKEKLKNHIKGKCKNLDIASYIVRKSILHGSIIVKEEGKEIIENFLYLRWIPTSLACINVLKCWGVSRCSKCLTCVGCKLQSMEFQLNDKNKNPYKAHSIWSFLSQHTSHLTGWPENIKEFHLNDKRLMPLRKGIEVPMVR